MGNYTQGDMNTTDLLSQDMGTDNLLATSAVATPNSVTPKIPSPCLEPGSRGKTASVSWGIFILLGHL